VLMVRPASSRRADFDKRDMNVSMNARTTNITYYRAPVTTTNPASGGVRVRQSMRPDVATIPSRS
jgi:hypothetical protein